MADSNITFTPNLNLAKLPANYRVWAQIMNDNLTILDAGVNSFVHFNNLRGPWTNSTAYVPGDSVVDAETAIIWTTSITHTSAQIPTTFLQERTNHPEYWGVTTGPGVNRGAWSGPGTVYNVNDIVLANGTTYARCLVQHVSGTTFDVDLALGYWLLLPPTTQLTTFRSFGAVGDGVTNDTAALLAAFAAQAGTGIQLSGEGLTYATVGLMLMTAAKVWIEDCTFKDISPTNGGVAHYMLRHPGPMTSFTMKNVKFNRNGDGTEGSLGANTLYLSSASNVLLEDIEVFGNGGGKAIAIETGNNIKIIRPYIHDMNWERSVNPLSETVEGIFMILCTSVLIDGHVIKNLTGTVLGVPQIGPVATYQNTDGISMGGCTDVRIVNGFTYNVGEGVDVTGSNNNNNVRLENNTYYDCAGYAEKFAHGAHDCSTIGGRYYRSGIAGLVLAGGTGGTDVFSPRNFTAVDCIAYDTGSAGLWQASQTVAGFVTQGGGVGPPPATPLFNIWFIDCKAYSTFQEYGLRGGGVSGGELHIVNFDTSGATISDYENVSVALSEITSVGRFAFTGGVDVLTGGLTTTTLDASGVSQFNDDVQIGTTTSNRFAKFDLTAGSLTSGATLRTDDDIGIPLWLQNHGINGVGDGIQIRFGITTGHAVTGQTAAIIEVLSTEDWSVVANQSVEMNFKTMQDGSLVDVMKMASGGLSSTRGFRSSHVTQGIGYATGAGGTNTQPGGADKTIACGLNRVCGTLITNNAALAANTSVSFVSANSSLEANDAMIIFHRSGGTIGAYNVSANVTGAGSATVTIRNLTGGSLSESLTLQFVVIKAVIA